MWQVGGDESRPWSRAQKAASVQFSSVAQLCPTLCDPMNRSTPGLPLNKIKLKAQIGAESFRTLHGHNRVLFFVLRSVKAMDLGIVLSRERCIYFSAFKNSLQLLCRECFGGSKR